MKRFITHALALAATAAASSPALAFEYSTCFGQPVRWASSGQTFRSSDVSFPAGYWRDTLNRTGALFNQNPSQAFMAVVSDVGGVGLDNGENEVWGSTDPAVLGGAPAIAYWWNTCFSIFGLITNHLDESDVIFNYGSPWQWTGDETKSSLIYYGGTLRQMQGTGIHEFGHAFGLMHENDEYNIMGADFTHIYANSGTAHGYLGEDASDGLYFIYGAWGVNYQDLSVSHWKYDFANGEYSWHRRVRMYDKATGLELPTTTINSEPGYVVNRGQKVRVEFTLENSGESSQSPNVGYYVSTNDWITTADRRINKTDGTFLSRDNVLTYTKAMKIPSDLTANTNYWLGAIIDYDGLIAEADESNNATYIPIRVN